MWELFRGLTGCRNPGQSGIAELPVLRQVDQLALLSSFGETGAGVRLNISKSGFGMSFELR